MASHTKGNIRSGKKAFYRIKPEISFAQFNENLSLSNLSGEVRVEVLECELQSFIFLY